MQAKSPFRVTRRRSLAILALAPLAGCAASSAPSLTSSTKAGLPRQRPQKLAMLPAGPEGPIGLEHMAAGLGLSGARSGLSRTALWGGHRSRSRDFTRLLSQNGLSASHYLNRQILTRAAARRIDLTELGNSATTESAIDNWSFGSLAATADAVVHLKLKEIGYSSIYTDAFWPRIHATLTLASTLDNARLGQQDYLVRIDARTADQRDKRPDRLARFQSVNELMANPRLVVKMLHTELDSIAQLIALDLEALTRGQATKWGTV